MYYSFIFMISAPIEDDSARQSLESLARFAGEVCEHKETVVTSDSQYAQRDVRSFMLKYETRDASPSNAINALFTEVRSLMALEDTPMTLVAARLGAHLSCYVVRSDTEPLFFSDEDVNTLQQLRCSVGIDFE